jgi:hypothetical protein
LRVRASFRTKLFLAFLGVSLLLSAVLLHFAWRRAREAQLAALQTLLRTTVAAAAPEIDGDAHAALGPRLSPDILSDPGYLALRRLAERLVASNPKLFHEVYTVDTVNGRARHGAALPLQIRREIGRPTVRDHPRHGARPRGAERRRRRDDRRVRASPRATRPSRTAAAARWVPGIDVDGSTVDAMRGGCSRPGAGAGGGCCSRRRSGCGSRRASTAGPDALAGHGSRRRGQYGTRVTWASGDEFESLATNFNAMAAGLEERQRLKSALHVAMEIQQSLLPARPPNVEGLDLSGFSDYCDETGGDYFDYPPSWPVGPGRTALTVGDVTGHGIAAALMMSSARAALRTQAGREESPGALLALVNGHLARDATAGKFMTLFYGVLDPTAGTLRYANAGQGGCFVVRAATGAVEELEAGGPPLGVVAGIPFPDATVTGLRAGDVVVLGTDGIWETADASGTMFGMERFHRLAREHAGKDAAAIAQVIRDATEVIAARGPRPTTSRWWWPSSTRRSARRPIPRDAGAQPSVGGGRCARLPALWPAAQAPRILDRVPSPAIRGVFVIVMGSIVVLSARTGVTERVPPARPPGSPGAQTRCTQ